MNSSADLTCECCGRPFTLTPPPERPEDWRYCLAPDCASYDPKRDLDARFGGPQPQWGTA